MSCLLRLGFSQSISIPSLVLIWHCAQKKLSKICKHFCKDAGLTIVFTFFKINNYFSTWDKTPYFLKSFLVYKFVYASCNSCYIGETCRYFQTRIDKHVKKGKKSNVCKHLYIYTIIKNLSQVLIQIVFLFYFRLYSNTVPNWN